MLRYVGRRVAGLALVLIIVLTLVFFMLRAAPGGPVDAYLGMNPTPEKRAEVEHRFGLDQPLWVQYAKFLGNLASGDLGRSLFSDRPVSGIIAERLPVTLEVSLVAFLFWVVIGLAAGAFAAHRRDSFVDGFIRVISVIALSIPSFWLALVLVVVFGLYVKGVLPSSGWVPFGEDPWNNMRSVVLPAFALGLGAGAIIARTLRASMIETARTDYVSFARAMGMSERVILSRITLRNAIIPTATVIGLMLGTFISGTVLIENVFNVPGIGQTIVSAFRQHDYPLAIACTLITASVFLVANLVVDLLYFVLNPRIRAGFLNGTAR
ncbi:ABC transporter permease [Streptosporangium amethystogenes]|uniref:ABC transporter permease n=1 Tax=Streptosporangium amethystogenes TaxID=2002 RepID=UPI0004C58475|nr:ABC transporter permease [Streptosporangium amethystogenes]